MTNTGRPIRGRTGWSFSVDSQKLADHNQFHDNIFDLFPKKTIEHMASGQATLDCLQSPGSRGYPPPSGLPNLRLKTAPTSSASECSISRLSRTSTSPLDVLTHVKSRPPALVRVNAGPQTRNPEGGWQWATKDKIGERLDVSF